MNANYIQQLSARVRCPVSDHCPQISVSGREVHFWLKMVGMLDRMEDKLRVLKTDTKSAVLVAGCHTGDKGGRMFYFFDCVGEASGKIRARGLLLFPDPGFEDFAAAYSEAAIFKILAERCPDSIAIVKA